MTTTAAASEANDKPWHTHRLSGWLALAAAPTFALMASLTATNVPAAALCSAAAGLPINGMTAMYLLMSLFHLSPWLRLASGCPQACN